MLKKHICLALALITFVGALTGCSKDKNEENADPVTIRIAGSWEDCQAIEAVGRKFSEKYSNCSIVYEYLQDYYKSLEKRMAGENAVDIFFVGNIQKDSDMLPYALELKSCEGLDLSDTFDGLIDNFTFREEGSTQDKLYSIPLGAEMRGMCVNKTLLGSLDIDVPTDQKSLLAACEKLKENGYIPFHGNPGSFSQTLLYPWICNIIAHAENPEEAYNKVNNREKGISEMLRKPYEFLYTLVENNYYDYKAAQNIPFDKKTDTESTGIFSDSTDEATARYFLNIKKNINTYEKVDDIGQIAFMPIPMSTKSVIDKTKEDYHSKIEYEFIPAPVGEEGGFAYMSPAHGIAINKDSVNQEWNVKFIDFLFKSDNNKIFAEEFNIIPNTKGAFNYITQLYSIPDNRISHLGMVTFDYDFYGTLTGDKKSLLELSKSNNPKYMKTNDDGTTSLYPLDHFLNMLEENIESAD